MDKLIKKLWEKDKTTTAEISSNKMVVVTTQDGEVYSMYSDIGKYSDSKTREYILDVIEKIFDKNFSEDKEQMIRDVKADFFQNGINCLGINSGSRHGNRIRIGQSIRKLREDKHMEAKELARLAGIDAANLSRIEQGKYSTGVDVLVRIAVVLDAHLDIIANNRKD